MKKKINTINLLALGLIVFTVTCTLIRTVAVLTAFDTHVGYFNRSEIIAFFDRSFFAVAVIFGAVASFLSSRSAITVSTPTSLWSVFASILLGFVWAISALLLFLLGMEKISILGYVASATAILSSVYYIYEGFRPARSLSNYRAVAIIIPIISLISIVFIENFDFNIALNSTDKQLTMFIFILAALYTVQRLKLLSENPSPRFYVYSAYLTVFLCIYFAIPAIIGNLAHVFDEPKYLVYALLSIGIAIYSAIDLVGRIKLSSYEDTAPTVISDPN